MSGLRFAFVTTFYPPHNFGGDGIGVQRWARALVRRGHHVTVICDTDVYHLLRTGPAPEHIDEEPGITVHRLRTAVAPVSVLLTQQTGRPVVNGARIRRILDEGRFDVINYHNVSTIGGPGILDAGSAIKLYTAWEHWLVCPTHVLWRHNREACPARECVRCVLHYGRPPQLWRYTGYLARQLAKVDAFIALSRFSRAKHREFGFPRDMDVIPGFLPDPEAGESPAWGPPPNIDDRPRGSNSHHRSAANDTDSPHHRPYFLFVGRLERIKGLDDVIPVFERYPEADLLIAGDGTYRATLEGIARGNPRVKFLGALPEGALGRYYAHAVASLVPTAGFETFGFVVIEAFRRGTPVIARRIGPLPELIEQCGGGMTFGTPEELAQAMRRLQHEPGHRTALARAAYHGFLTNWTESAVLPSFFELLDRVARARGEVDILRALDAGRAA
ncbi:MAG: glycosyltransferase family 4 protein [Gemmatimonadota bacterium]|nr:glycosyltransferase family 4 protein [Gemmatimonadota bacterium]